MNRSTSNRNRSKTRMASAALSGRRFALKFTLGNRPLLCIVLSSSPRGSTENEPRGTGALGRRGEGRSRSCFSPPGRNSSAWEKGRAIFSPGAHDNLTPAADGLSVTDDSQASDDGETKNGRHPIQAAADVKP